MSAHALITGASRGIGAALLSRLASDGYRVTGTSTAGTGDLVGLDVTDTTAIDALGQLFETETLDLLVCNAGIFEDRGMSPDTGYPADLWARTFAVNVTGVFLTIQALLPALRRADAPKIAIISSQMASDTTAPGGSYIYRASKAAALNLGRNLATDLKPDGIAIGIYHPGWVRTDMGGAAADISETQSADGLASEFARLTLGKSGCFRTWDGRDHPF